MYTQNTILYNTPQTFDSQDSYLSTSAKQNYNQKNFSVEIDTLLMLHYVDNIFDSKAFIETENKNSEIKVIEGDNVRCFITSIEPTQMATYVDAILDNKMYSKTNQNLAENKSKSVMVFKFKIPESELISNSIDFHQVIVNESNNAAYVYLSTTVSSLKLAKQLVDELYEMGIRNVEIIQQNDFENETENYIEID